MVAACKRQWLFRVKDCCSSSCYVAWRWAKSFRTCPVLYLHRLHRSSETRSLYMEADVALSWHDIKEIKQTFFIVIQVLVWGLVHAHIKAQEQLWPLKLQSYGEIKCMCCVIIHETTVVMPRTHNGWQQEWNPDLMTMSSPLPLDRSCSLYPHMKEHVRILLKAKNNIYVSIVDRLSGVYQSHINSKFFVRSSPRRWPSRLELRCVRPYVHKKFFPISI